MSSFPMTLLWGMALLAVGVGGTLLMAARTKAMTLKYNDKPLVYAAIFVPLLATILYLKLGSPDYLDQPFETRSASVLVPQRTERLTDNPNEPSDINEVIRQIKEKLPQVAGMPQETMGWMMLGRAYTRMKDYPNAQECYHKALERVKNPEMKTRIQIEYLSLLQEMGEGTITGEGRLILDDLSQKAKDNPEIRDVVEGFKRESQQ